MLVGVALALAEVLLDLNLQLFSATLDVLAGIVRCITEVATHLAFHFLDQPSLCLVLDATGFSRSLPI